MQIRLLEYEDLQKMVDYSFGDQSGVLGRVPNAYMKKANLGNLEFINAVTLHRGDLMTLFIDNIRLYKRKIEYSDWLHQKPISQQDREWLSQFDDEDLLELCSKFPEKKFTIFTAFEDTPLDEFIEGRIPENVRSINATNAVYLCDKIHPMPHGLERIMRPGYDHHDILRKYIDIDITASKLLYVNHREDTGDRTNLRSMLRSWATISERLSYEPYLKSLKEHKFVLCPSGNGIGSARNWETLYMRRVPVLEWHPYKEVVFQKFPVLYVNNYAELSPDLLENNLHLFEKAQKMDMTNLDLLKIYKERLLL